MDAIDELHGLKNLYYLGAYQQVVNDATNPALSLRSDIAKLERKVYLHRAYLAQKRFTSTISEISDTDATAPELRAVRALAQYLSSLDSNSAAGRENAVTSARSLLGNGGVASSPLLAVLVATVFYHEELFEEALKTLAAYPRSLECEALAVQIYLKINRVDLAIKEIASIKTWADDASLAQMIEAWANLYVGEEKIQESFYTFDELSSTSSTSSTSKLLVGKAVAKIHMGQFPEAEELLLESLNRNSSDPETLINLIVCARATGKPGEVVARFFDQLKDTCSNHAFLQDMALKEAMFDRAAKRFAL